MRSIEGRGGGTLRRVALAGNPNVGKSTVFNALTGLNQHTGNWSGKTVALADGEFSSDVGRISVTDLPGTYSLYARSPEEEVAGEYVCFGGSDAVVAVCDATCLLRNMNLVLQIIEASENAVVCLNLMDEARRKGIDIDVSLLSERLGSPVCAVSARSGSGLDDLRSVISEAVSEGKGRGGRRVIYSDAVEAAADRLSAFLLENYEFSFSARWAALRLLEREGYYTERIFSMLGAKPCEGDKLYDIVLEISDALLSDGISCDDVCDEYAAAVSAEAERICKGAVTEPENARRLDEKIDKIITGRSFGYPIMLGLVAICFFITVWGAEPISDFLSRLLFSFVPQMRSFLEALGVSSFLSGLLVDGGYTTLAFVVSVMLPPMAIFFPLFTLLEDVGYLPRVAYNLDKPFACCSACGKQSLTMCMSLGCTAVGVCGCRIIDSKRERLLAVLTASFMPCNGKLPTLVSVIALFLVGGGGAFSSAVSAAILTAVMLFCILMTFAATKLLSVTVLRGAPSSFVLELPPYRPPKLCDIIVRSLLDRTLKLLARAAAIAFPCGLIIWLLANLGIGGESFISYISCLLDPLGSALGLDGAVICAFLLGLPANEIVLPIAMMIYTSSGSVTLGAEMGEILLANGWDATTAISFIVFSLLHWPCATTLRQIKKETGGIGYTLLAAALPTLFGVILCMLFNLFA